jgi:two-component system sensor histidine kinase RegB
MERRNVANCRIAAPKPPLESGAMSASPPMNIPTPVTLDTDARQNLRWLFVLRNLILAGEALIVFISVYGLDIPLRETPLWGIMTILLLFNWWTWVRLSGSRPVAEVELFIQLSFDVLAITAILYFTGGATNPIAWFFLLPLIIAATVLPQSYTWYMVIFTSGCYTILIGFYEPLPDIQPMTLQGDSTRMVHAMMERHDIELHVFGMWFGFVFSAVLVAYFVVEMANTLRERERRIAEIREQSLRNERVIALGTLAAGAAHEMGTPLGTMAILIREIEKDGDAAIHQDLLGKMKILREQVDRCKKALSVMSASAGEIRAEAGHIMPLDSYLDATVDSWRQQRLNTPVDYRKTGPIPAPFILAELTLTHALINILNNAAEVSPQGIELSVRWDHERARLKIMDRGPGIAPTVSERLGKAPVSSTKEHGLGVGLFLAFATIERLGGSIEMTPRPEGGTCTHVVLPLVSGSSRR